jgi:adenosine deaminase
MEDDYTIALARERGTAFEVCVTSNYQTGVLPPHETHPLQSMLDAGLNVTINTDDPSVSRITLGHEYRLVRSDLGISEDALKGCIVTAAQASFIPEKDKKELVRGVRKELKL